MSKNFEMLSRYYAPYGALHKHLPSQGTIRMPSEHTSSLTDPSVPGGESDLRRTVRILRKRRGAFVLFATAIFFLAAFATMLMGIWWPRYEPGASIEVDPPGQEAFSMDRGLASSADPDYVGTQVQLLQSDDLLIAVIRELHLDQVAELTSPKWYAPILRVFKRKWVGSSKARPDEIVLTSAENAALKQFQERLSVDHSGNSRLITVSFSSEDPHLAADVTNALVRTFIDQYYKGRYDAVMQSSEWLSRQLDDIRQRMEHSNQALARYQKLTGITDIDDKQSTFTQRAAAINQQLTQAEADRIQTGSYLSRVQLGDEDSLQQVHDNPVIQGLKQQLVDARAALAQATAVYGDDHPDVQKLQSLVNERQSATEKEEQKIVAGLKNSYAAAADRQRMMAGIMKGMIDEMNKMSNYSELRKSAQTNTDLYNALYQRVKEAGISAASKSSNITVGGRARVLDLPTSPHVVLNLAIGLFVGLVGGVALAFVRETYDDKIRSPEQLKNYIGLTPLSIVPLISREPALLSENGRKLSLWRRLRAASHDELGQKFVLERPLSPESEAVRALKTSLLLSLRGGLNAIIVSSPGSGEGKTTLAVNIAIALAELGRTCLIDIDARRPMISNTFAAEEKDGLADVISGTVALEKAVREVPSVPGLSLIPIGSLPPNPGAFVISAKMREVVLELRRKFEFLVIDSPPLLPFADARILSRLADGIVLVGRSNCTTRQAMLRSLEILDEVRTPVLGVVLNAVDGASQEYDYSRYYPRYGQSA